MPRKARIDAAGGLHHIIVRGIERRKIFWDDADRDSFVNRLGQVLIDVHLLMRTGLRFNT
jgi:putative transposase